MSDTFTNPELCCVRCGYALKGIPDTAACPECGTRVDESLVARRGPGGELESPRRFVWGARLATLIASAEVIFGSMWNPRYSIDATWLPTWAIDRVVLWGVVGASMGAAMVWTAMIFVSRQRASRSGAIVAAGSALTNVAFMFAVIEQPSELGPLIGTVCPALVVVGLCGRAQWLRRIIERWQSRQAANLFVWHAWGMTLLVVCALVSSLLAVVGHGWAARVLVVSLCLAGAVQAAAQWNAAEQVARWKKFVRRRG